jgi:hypothetical protein
MAAHGSGEAVEEIAETDASTWKSANPENPKGRKPENTPRKLHAHPSLAAFFFGLSGFRDSLPRSDKP